MGILKQNYRLSSIHWYCKIVQPNFNKKPYIFIDGRAFLFSEFFINLVMETYDYRIDIYIEKSADFAKPILDHLRKIIHQASPEINETIKWGFPHFDYKGTVCSMASFKNHCAFGFWKNSLMDDPHGLLKNDAESAMGQFGRICDISNVPADEILISYIQNAVALNKAGVKIVKTKEKISDKTIEVPTDFSLLLDGYPEVQVNFENLSYSHKKEYVEWFIEAKTKATRSKRMQTAIEWLTEGKSRHWKYK
ncbi:MAG: hypothetical protein JWN56_1357 [Sphingobacteriales bacterium]|nr:hypothetical protein [Sphingobacteriales bacterium]